MATDPAAAWNPGDHDVLCEIENGSVGFDGLACRCARRRAATPPAASIQEQVFAPIFDRLDAEKFAEEAQAAREFFEPRGFHAAHAAHTLHVAGMSVRELARRTWERYGYASASSCESGLHHAFRRYGLSRRSQADATALLPQRYVYRGGRTHGTVATYGAGCHCGPCRAAQTARMRRYRAERVA